MTASPIFAADTHAGAQAEGTAAAAAGGGSFVLNLCSSTTPMALAQVELPELKRFNFFVSRRFEEGRERFRLHMGYFATLAEAEEWLAVVREIYPGAWAGDAPGRKLRERAAAANAEQARHAIGPQTRLPPPAARGAGAAAVSAPLLAAPRPIAVARPLPPAPKPAAAPAEASARVPVVHAAQAAVPPAAVPN